MLITGLAGIILIEIYAAVMQRCFQNTDNRIGKGFAILGIYLFVVCYCTLPTPLNSTLANLNDQTACSTVLHGYTAPRYSLLLFAARSWALQLLRTSSSMLPVSFLFQCRLSSIAKYFRVTEAGPSAFATIHENYYYVFVVCSAFFLAIAYFYFPETKQKTLEEVAAAFGDRVVDQDEGAKRAVSVVGEAQHIESTDGTAKAV